MESVNCLNMGLPLKGAKGNWQVSAESNVELRLDSTLLLPKNKQSGWQVASTGKG